MKRLYGEEWIIGSVLILMVVVVAAQVVSRYVLHASLSFTEEIVRYLFVWITFLGAAAALIRGNHLSITGISSLLPERFQRILWFLRGLGAFVLIALIGVYGIRVAFLQARTGQTTAALGMPMWVIGLAIPTGSVLFVLRLALLAKRGEQH